MIVIGLYRSTLPLILWGPSLAKTLTIGWPLQEVETDTVPADESERLRGKVAVLDGWSLGEGAILKATVPDIPNLTGVSSYGTRTGWDSADGWQDFLEWAREGRPFTFIPDAEEEGDTVTVELVAPWDEPPSVGFVGRRTLVLTLRAVDPAVRFEGY